MDTPRYESKDSFVKRTLLKGEQLAKTNEVALPTRESDKLALRGLSGSVVERLLSALDSAAMNARMAQNYDDAKEAETLRHLIEGALHD